jgi:glycosyltransferase involved in cell wall biosynthesis
MTKSIFIYTPSLKFGGAEKALVTLANCLVDTKYHVTYCYSEEGELAKELEPSISQINLEKPRMLSSVFPLYQALTKHKPDVIVTTLVHCNIMLLLISFIYNLFNTHQVKVIVRETTNIALRLEQMSVEKRFIFKLLMKLTYPKAKTVVFPNESLKTKFKSYFGLAMSNGVVIYNSSSFNPNIIEEKQKISFSAEKKLTLLSVGRLTKTKRVEDLLYAVAQLPKELDVNVDIVGTGPEEQNLMCLAERLNIAELVNFKGFLNQPFANYRPENTMFVLTSELEGMPNSLIEALCSGLPCISANCEFGPDEIFENFEINKTWLYSPRNINELTFQLMKIFSSNHKYELNYLKGYRAFSYEKYLFKYKQVIE